MKRSQFQRYLIYGDEIMKERRMSLTTKRKKPWMDRQRQIYLASYRRRASERMELIISYRQTVYIYTYIYEKIHKEC